MTVWLTVTDTAGKKHAVAESSISQATFSDADQAVRVVLHSGGAIDIAMTLEAFEALLSGVEWVIVP